LYRIAKNTCPTLIVANDDGSSFKELLLIRSAKNEIAEGEGRNFEVSPPQKGGGSYCGGDKSQGRFNLCRREKRHLRDSAFDEDKNASWRDPYQEKGRSSPRSCVGWRRERGKRGLRRLTGMKRGDLSFHSINRTEEKDHSLPITAQRGKGFDKSKPRLSRGG